MAAGEEFDDFESWEEMEDAGVLDKKIEKLKAAMSTSLQKDLRTGIGGTGKSNTVVFLAEDGRTRYVPPEPTVKILKRPSVVNNSHNAGGDGFIVNGDNSGKPKQPIKTLQQREMEYAEARLRILGEAQSPDERPALLERIRRIQNKIESVPEPYEQNISSPSLNSSTVINSIPIIMTSTHSQINITNSCGAGVGGGGVSVIANYSGAGQYPSNNLNNQSQQHQQNIAGYSLLNHHYSNNYVYHNHYHHMNNTLPSQNVSPVSPAAGSTVITTSPNNIIITSPISYNLAIRQPKGPDGTKGFHLRTLR